MAAISASPASSRRPTQDDREWARMRTGTAPAGPQIARARLLAAPRFVRATLLSRKYDYDEEGQEYPAALHAAPYEPRLPSTTSGQAQAPIVISDDEDEDAREYSIVKVHSTRGPARRRPPATLPSSSSIRRRVIGTRGASGGETRTGKRKALSMDDEHDVVVISDDDEDASGVKSMAATYAALLESMGGSNKLSQSSRELAGQASDATKALLSREETPIEPTSVEIEAEAEHNGSQQVIPSATSTQASVPLTASRSCPDCGMLLPEAASATELAQHRASMPHRLALALPGRPADIPRGAAEKRTDHGRVRREINSSHRHGDSPGGGDDATSQRIDNLRRASDDQLLSLTRQANRGFGLLETLGWTAGMGIGMEEWRRYRRTQRSALDRRRLVRTAVDRAEEAGKAEPRSTLGVGADATGTEPGTGEPESEKGYLDFRFDSTDEGTSSDAEEADEQTGSDSDTECVGLETRPQENEGIHAWLLRKLEMTKRARRLNATTEPVTEQDSQAQAEASDDSDLEDDANGSRMSTDAPASAASRPANLIPLAESIRMQHALDRSGIGASRFHRTASKLARMGAQRRTR